MAKVSSLLREEVARCASWEDFVRQLKKKSDKDKGDLFEHLVRAFLQLDPEYATKLCKVWLLEDVPAALRKRLHLPASDQGIDLIAETNTGEYWAIQCKYREDTVRPLPWREISTFTGLAFGVCRHISFGLVCSTTERITHVLTHQDRIGFCALDVWQGLDKEFFDRLRKLLGHKPTKLVPLKPRPHQKQAIADARKHFVGKKQKRGKLISPCGSGKSLTAYWIARDLKAKKIVVAVPSLALIRQTLKVWLRESLAHDDTVEWICVCSDESAGRVEQDDVAVLRQDLGVPCLTDPKEIASWLKQKKPGLTVVFTTYQSGEALGKAARKARFSFDLGIMDEAHKTVGDGDKLFSHLLHDKNLPIRRRIFMTATERRYRGKGDKILSMDNAAIYGDTFHLLSFKKAIEQQPRILSPYQIITISVAAAEVNELIKKNVFLKPNKGRWNKEIEAEMLASLVALRKAMRKYPIRHAVSFHSSIQRAQIFKDHNDAYNHALKKHGTIETFHVSGKTPTGTRARIVNEFAATKRGLITNARCLTEGVDVPDIDCVLFADPRRSAVDIVQAVGRALRPAKGKKMGYVIVPIVQDRKAKSSEVLDFEEFQEVLTTLRALAANDERIVEYFRSIASGKKRSKGGLVIFDIDEKIARHISLEQFTRDIELRCWNRLARLSWRPFEEARSYVRGLGLKNEKEWRILCKDSCDKKTLPADIPTNPSKIYSEQGWAGMGDWLGTGRVAPQLRHYRSYREAKAFAQSIRLPNVAAWREFCKGHLPKLGFLPADVPATPHLIYKDKGWLGYGDWLGTGTIAPSLRKYRSFLRAKAFARSLHLKSRTEWIEFCKGRLPSKGVLPADIPANPWNTYSNKGWAGLGDWLGTGRIADQLRRYRSFKSARAFARSLKLKTGTEWRAFCKGLLPAKGTLPDDISANPNQTYAGKGWAGFGDWLGTGTMAPRLREYRPFKTARAFVRKLNLKSRNEWDDFCKGRSLAMGKLPSDIPASPWNIYADKGWAGLGDWLGTGRIADHLRQYRSFKRARAFARSLELRSGSEWREFCKGRLPNKGFLPTDIPACPNQTYASNGWCGFGDWLGTGTVAPRLRVFRTFKKARSFARKLSLRGEHEWRAYCRGDFSNSKPSKPLDIPYHPERTYSNDGWAGYSDWLGIDRKRKVKRRR